jgi:hypothetical protein
MRHLLCLLTLALAVALVGCGAPRSNVSGTVSYKGKALTAGTIILLAPDNKTHPADIGPDGKYQVAGVARGKVKVAVIVEGPRLPPRPDPVKSKDPVGGKEAKADDAKGMARLKEAVSSLPGSPIPAHYSDAARSGLEFELKDPEQTFSPDLK